MRGYMEIPFFFLIFAFALSDNVTINLIVYRTCYLILPFNQSECALLGTGTHNNSTMELEKEVQPHAAVIRMTKYLMETVLSSFLCFFLGPWSDRYGRRPVLLFTLGGYTVAYLITTVISALPNLSPWFLLVTTVPVFVVGGFPALLTVTVCYILESSSTETKGLRMGLYEATITAAIFTGSILTSLIFKSGGYLLIYIITTSCLFFAWLFVWFAIPETIAVPEREGKIRNLFKLSLVRETVQTTFKRRSGCDRALLLLTITIMVIFLLAVTADGGIVFLYLRRKLDWSLQTYMYYNAGRTLSWVTGSIIAGYFLHKLFRVEESVLMLLGFASVMASAVIQGAATKDWHMYLSGSTRCLGGGITPMSRTLISKIVTPEEAGKVFSFLVASETLVDLIGSPTYTYIYNNTISTLPGLFNFITAGIYGVEFLLTIAAIVLQMKQQQQPSIYKMIEEEEVDNLYVN